MSRKIYNLIILDRSGSMSSMRNEAVASVNETIGTIKSFINENPDSQQTVSLVTFCSCSRNYIYDMNDARIADHIKAEDYQPCCGTPLYDAIGEACNRLHKTIENEKDADCENDGRYFDGRYVGNVFGRICLLRCDSVCCTDDDSTDTVVGGDN